MKLLSHHTAIILSALLMVSCASYKAQYSRSVVGWENDTIPANIQPTHIMYLVGDAGDNNPADPAPVLTYLKTKLADESRNSSIVFLGDNIYPSGMPPKEDAARRAVAEYRLLSQLKILDDFAGRPVFLPGNHDWRGWNLKGLKRQEKFVEKYINQRRGITDKDDYEDYFLPQDGCPGTEVVELNDNVVLLVVDSEWWLHNWEKAPGINTDCGIKNRAAFQFAFENVMRKYRNKQVVVAMHHPLYTYGSHGGNFTIKQHLFPLTDINKKLWIPLPVIGTLGVFFRTTIGSRQDVANQHYRQLRKALLAGANKNGSFIFAAGHEHSLEHIQRSEQTIIVSGSGSKTTPVKLGKGAAFVSGRPGYSTISFYEDGRMLVQYWQVNKTGSAADLSFQTIIKKEFLIAQPTDSTLSSPIATDSVYTSLTLNEVRTAGPLHRFFLGAHHRQLYTMQYKFPVLNLEEFQGGVTPEKLGGGNQTNSLRVEDKSGRDFVLRGLDKDVSRLLPFPLNRMSAAKYIAEDNFLSTLPFAPLAVAPLAEAIKVYHTNPVLYYVPKQPALGIYNPVFGNRVSLVEERPKGKKWDDAATFGKPYELVGTPDVLDDILDNNKFKVDQPWALRTRLLDFLIGDWDRHDDQWTWAAFKQEDGSRVYRPVPRDRDQAFSKYDGLVTGLARFTMPFLRQLQVYGPEIASRKWNTWSARLFDRSFLTELDWSQWQEQVHFIQKQLTDAVIENAFNSWPEKARTVAAPDIIKAIKHRRDNLESIARTHYDFINKRVTIAGTEEKERFVVDRVDDDHTRLTVYEISKDGDIKKINYQRLFNNNTTSVVNVFGNGSGDEFRVKGNVSKGIKIRLIGGDGKDQFYDSSRVEGGGGKTYIYDDLRTNTVVAGPDTKDRRTNKYRFNIYDRRDAASEYNILVPLPVIGANPDDGFLLGATFNMIRYGFKKEPFKSQQVFGATYAFATRAFKLQYIGDFINAIGSADFYVDAHYHGPTYAFNFAGIGNDTKRPVDDPDYYRVRQSELTVFPAIKKRLGLAGFIALGPFLQANEIEETQGRFLVDSIGPGKAVFNRKYFTGARLLFDFNSVDNLLAPHSGIRFFTSFNYIESLKDDRQFGALRGKFSFYKALDRRENFILASQVGGGLNIGSGYEFFQMPTIGGEQGLRGYRTQRFYGRSVFWHNTDLRIRFGSSYNQTLPFTAGMFGSFDYGRVWQEKVSSNTMHYNYGGGLWFAFIDLLTFTLGAHIPREEFEEKPRVVLKLGFGL